MRYHTVAASCTRAASSPTAADDQAKDHPLRHAVAARRREAGPCHRRARDAEAELILLSAALVPALPPDELESALLGEVPLVAIVPDAHGRHAPPDVAREVRLALGIEP